MNFELTQRFYFEAAHTLERTYDAEASRRIHGHTYHAAVTVAGPRSQETGMVTDLAVLRRAIERVRVKLDHCLLDEVPELGPPTMENLCIYILNGMAGEPCAVKRVEVSRQASGDSCTLVP